jgi:hypothetical protein
MTRSVRITLVLATLVALGVGLVPVADAHTSPAQACRASAVRATLGPVVLEPFVANPPGGPPCPTDSAGLLGTTTVGPVTVTAVSARTGVGGNDADASVARATVNLGGQVIVIEGLTSTTNSSCRPDDSVAFGSSGSVARVAAGETTLLNVNRPLTIPLSPVVTVELNKTTKTSDTVTRQAAVITTPAGEVVLAESTAGSHCELEP